MGLFDSVFRIIDTMFVGVGIAVNSLLIYCILTQTPQSAGSYTVLLANMAVGDLITCLLTVFVEPRLVTFQKDIYVIFNGFCQNFGHKTCGVGYAAMMIFYAHLVFSQLGSFIYRRYVLTNTPPTKRTMVLILAAMASPSVLILVTCSIPYVVSVWDFDARAKIIEIHPEMANDTLVHLAAVGAFDNPLGTIPTMWICFPITPITIAVFVMRKWILRLLGKESFMSETTRKLHKSFLMALSLQAGLPPIYLIGIACLMLDVGLGLHHIGLEYASYFLPGFIPVISPIFSLYFVKSYRNCVKKLVGMQVIHPAQVVSGPQFTPSSQSNSTSNNRVQPSVNLLKSSVY